MSLSKVGNQTSSQDPQAVNSRWVLDEIVICEVDLAEIKHIAPIRHPCIDIIMRVTANN